MLSTWASGGHTQVTRKRRGREGRLCACRSSSYQPNTVACIARIPQIFKLFSMSESVDEGYPELGPNLPSMATNLDALSTLPSSRSYEAWAASCPEVYLPFKVGGQAVNARAKLCAFCGNPIRCPSSDQSLVEHMKSNACRNVQQELEAEIGRSTGANLSNRAPSGAPRYAQVYLLV